MQKRTPKSRVREVELAGWENLDRGRGSRGRELVQDRDRAPGRDLAQEMVPEMRGTSAVAAVGSSNRRA